VIAENENRHGAFQKSGKDGGERIHGVNLSIANNAGNKCLNGFKARERGYGLFQRKGRKADG